MYIGDNFEERLLESVLESKCVCLFSFSDLEMAPWHTELVCVCECVCVCVCGCARVCINSPKTLPTKMDQILVLQSILSKLPHLREMQVQENDYQRPAEKSIQKPFLCVQSASLARMKWLTYDLVENKVTYGSVGSICRFHACQHLLTYLCINTPGYPHR